MSSPSPGQAIVAPYRGEPYMMSIEAQRVLDGIVLAIDTHLAVMQANLTSAIGAQRIALERVEKAEALAAERLAGLLAAAEFTTIMAKQLRLEQ